ncbi:hypothetical protein [Paraburkholderia heleia]|uniref:hypothetical protein n=1 Tax=Paraburkholderia heleia TaxID=634127 RepID=UPI00069372D1|nr:hypothetical protein [Paraburkholderia heleia]
MADLFNLPDPPYLPDTRAKGWRFELDLQRIEQSDTWALATPDLRPWLLMLWAVAWQQTPCGTLPTEDRLIAPRLGMPLQAFTDAKEVLLRGWWQANDGRLYHPTIAERVVEMCNHKDTERIRQRAYRARIKAEREAHEAAAGAKTSAGQTKTSTEQTETSDVVTRDKRVSNTVVPREYDTGTGTGNTVPNGTDAGASPDLFGREDDSQQSDEKIPTTKEQIWIGGKSLLANSGLDKKQAGTFLGKLIADYDEPSVLEAVQAGVSEQPADPRSYLKATCQRIAGERKSKGAAVTGWWKSDELALQQANLVGVGPAHSNEHRDSWHARIKAAIDNGGKPPERVPVAPVQSPAMRPEVARSEMTPEQQAANRAALKAALKGTATIVQSA